MKLNRFLIWVIPGVALVLTAVFHATKVSIILSPIAVGIALLAALRLAIQGEDDRTRASGAAFVTAGVIAAFAIANEWSTEIKIGWEGLDAPAVPTPWGYMVYSLHDGSGPLILAPWGVLAAAVTAGFMGQNVGMSGVRRAWIVGLILGALGFGVALLSPALQ